MLYKPKFCCECGEKIERPDWKPWTNRRFCELCETRHKGHDYAIRAGIGAALVLGTLGVGSYLRSGESTGEIKKDTAVPFVTKADIIPVKENPPATKTENLVPANIALETRSRRISADAETHNAEPLNFCGAATKKGTPCSRRVKGDVRCWQHAGQPALGERRKIRR